MPKLTRFVLANNVYVISALNEWRSGVSLLSPTKIEKLPIVSAIYIHGEESVMLKRKIIGFAIVLGLVSFSMGGAFADTSKKKIALSNNYAGNSWRQAMLRSWDKVTKKAVADGVVAAADAFTTAENQATEQAQQIQNMILQGYDAIVLNAA